MFLGIDLGTTNSAVAGVLDGNISLFRTIEGQDILPSLIYIDQGGRRFFGQRAVSQAFLSPTNVASAFKRRIGTKTRISFEGADEVLTPEQCSTEILKQLIAQARSHIDDEPFTGAVIGVPAAFNQLQNEATKRAAQQAGIDEVKLLQEPIAAAIASAEQAHDTEGHFLVFDLGGGTLDVALVRNLTGSLTVEHHDGVNKCGGTDFDRLIVTEIIVPWLRDKFDLPEDFQRQPEYVRLTRMIRRAAELAKLQLSGSSTSVVYVEAAELKVHDRSDTPIYVDVEIELNQITNLMMPILDRAVKVCKNVLKDSHFGASDISKVVFIGGPTRMPFLRNYISEQLGIQYAPGIDPMTAVAVGAAIFGETAESTVAASKRKKDKVSTRNSNGSKEIEFRFPDVSTEESARFRVRGRDGSLPDGCRIRIDADSGWSSGEALVDENLTINLPLDSRGPNKFTVRISGDSEKIEYREEKITIVRRVHMAGITASQTISVKVKDDMYSDGASLRPIIGKGTTLPVSGTHKFRAAVDVIAGEDSELHVQLFQDDGVPDPDLNIFLGNVTISGNDLPKGARIVEGDDVFVDWKMDESGILSATISVPAVGQTFRMDNVYFPGDGEIDSTQALFWATELIESAGREIKLIEESAGDLLTDEIEDLTKTLINNITLHSQASDDDTVRIVIEEVRRVRQEVSRLRNRPEVLRLAILQEFRALRGSFEELRERVDKELPNVRKFDQIVAKIEEIIADDGADINDLRKRMDALRQIHSSLAQTIPEILIAHFEYFLTRREKAYDRDRFDQQAFLAKALIEKGSFDELRIALYQMQELLPGVGEVGFGVPGVY